MPLLARPYGRLCILLLFALRCKRFSQLRSYVRVFLRHCDLVDCRIGALHNFGGIRAGLMTTRSKRVRTSSPNCDQGYTV